VFENSLKREISNKTAAISRWNLVFKHVLKAKIVASEDSKNLAVKTEVEKAKDDRESLIKKISELEAEISASTKEKGHAVETAKNELRRI
jgi:hypothetical protein